MPAAVPHSTFACEEVCPDLAGGLPVGSVIAGNNGERISEGRNRAYDPAGGTDRQREPEILDLMQKAGPRLISDVVTGIGGRGLAATVRRRLPQPPLCEASAVDGQLTRNPRGSRRACR
jgi:hypothetical protein